MAGEYQGEEYFLPLQDQRVFGAGIKRKRIPFVSASSLTSVADTAYPASAGSKKEISTVDRYLSIVLPNESSTSEPPPIDTTEPQDICAICSLPLTSSSSTSSCSIPHESLLAHQASLPHSHPPSHLPREHIGLKYLSSYGWDPDSRQGLGRSGEGIRIPIAGKVKNDTVGLGVDFSQKEEKGGKARRRRSGAKADETVKKLNVKEVRKMELEGRKKGEKLRKMFYGSEDVERYLGEAG